MKNLLMLAWGALIVILIAVVVSLWMHRVPETIPTESITTIQQQPTTTLPTNSDRAFIRIVQANASVVRGSYWSAVMASNTWSKCMADIHQPDGKLYKMDVAQSQAAMASPGGFVWNWLVPKDVPTGAWTIRFLCGKYDDLATHDVGLNIQ